MKEVNLELEKLNRDKEGMLLEKINEREHLKNEINDARHQLQHCLAEVRLIYIFNIIEIFFL